MSSYSLGGEGLSGEDLQRASRDSTIRDKAIRWFQDALKEVDDLAGRESTAAQRAIAKAVIFAELGAQMYGDLRKEFGDAIAQGVLKEGFALLGGILRRNGENVRLKVDASFAPVAAAPADVHYAAEEKVDECCCTRDADGRCAECVQLLRTFCSKMGESVKIVREARLSDKKLCRPCVRRHLDGAMAEFVRQDLSAVEPDMAEAMMKTLFMTGQSIQAMQMPLTTKAWDELQKSRPPEGE